MKNIKINREQAIAIMRNILREGCSIPMASIGNGDAGLCYVDPPTDMFDTLDIISALKDKSFRIVPLKEISEEFGGLHFSEDYDVCVEFTNSTGDYSEQFLLWDIDYYKD